MQQERDEVKLAQRRLSILKRYFLLTIFGILLFLGFAFAVDLIPWRLILPKPIALVILCLCICFLTWVAAWVQEFIVWHEQAIDRGKTSCQRLNYYATRGFGPAIPTIRLIRELRRLSFKFDGAD